MKYVKIMALIFAITILPHQGLIGSYKLACHCAQKCIPKCLPPPPTSLFLLGPNPILKLPTNAERWRAALGLNDENTQKLRRSLGRKRAAKKPETSVDSEKREPAQ